MKYSVEWNRRGRKLYDVWVWNGEHINQINYTDPYLTLEEALQRLRELLKCG